MCYFIMLRIDWVLTKISSIWNSDGRYHLFPIPHKLCIKEYLKTKSYSVVDHYETNE